MIAHMRFRGGADHTIELPLPLRAWELRQTHPSVVAEIDSLLDHHTDAEIAEILNQRGIRPKAADRFTPHIVANARRSYGLVDRFTRLRGRQLLTLDEMAARVGVTPHTVKVWQRAGLLTSQRYNDKGGRLFEPPGPNAPIKWTHKFKRSRPGDNLIHNADEVQSVA